MRKRRRLRRPYFAKVKLLSDGTVELMDDDGERFHVSMHRAMAWPVIGRVMRRFEMEERGERVKQQRNDEPPPPPRGGKPTLVA